MLRFAVSWFSNAPYLHGWIIGYWPICLYRLSDSPACDRILLKTNHKITSVSGETLTETENQSKKAIKLNWEQTIIIANYILEEGKQAY